MEVGVSSHIGPQDKQTAHNFKSSIPAPQKSPEFGDQSCHSWAIIQKNHKSTMKSSHMFGNVLPHFGMRMRDRIR